MVFPLSSGGSMALRVGGVWMICMCVVQFGTRYWDAVYDPGSWLWVFRAPQVAVFSLLSFLPCWALGSPPVSVFGCWRVSLDIQLNRGPPGAAAFFGAGVCYLSGLFSSPGPGEGGVVSGELLALAFGSGCFGWLRVWVWVCCFQLCSPGRSSRGRTSELLCWAGGMVPGELLALAFWLQLASCWGSSLCL